MSGRMRSTMKMLEDKMPAPFLLFMANLAFILLYAGAFTLLVIAIIDGSLLRFVAFTTIATFLHVFATELIHYHGYRLGRMSGRLEPVLKEKR